MTPNPSRTATDWGRRSAAVALVGGAAGMINATLVVAFTISFLQHCCGAGMSLYSRSIHPRRGPTQLGLRAAW